MTTKTWQRIFSYLVLAGLLLSLTHPGAAQAKLSVVNPAARAASQTAQAKIEQQVLDELAAKGQTDFIIVMKDQADLSATSSMKTKVEKGDFVYNTLRVTADRTQKGLRTYLDKQGAKYTSYYIVNAILVSGGTQDLVMAIASRSDVASVSANHAFRVEADKPLLKDVGPEAPAAVEPNITFVNADDVWALGDTGQGMVLAGNDTGLLWTHPAIQPHYRGWNGVTADHNYNWWSAVPGSYPEPSDGGGYGGGYGTMSTGTMVGDDGAGNQIGMAPGAKTIHCKNQLNPYGDSQDAWYTECFEWDLAPWDLNGDNPRPDMAPDAVNVPWNPNFGGNNNIFRTAVDNLLAAGIVVSTSAGNGGPYCSSLRSPGDYKEVLTTGSVSSSSGVLPGTLSYTSSRGPSLLDGNYFPDVMAPGQDIRSSINWYSGYTYWSGTQAASPHVTALIGLMWSANPALRGMVDTTMQIIKDTAVPLTGQTGNNCGGDYAYGPNNDWGFGTIDALAAVQMAKSYHSGTLDGTVTQSVGGAPIEGANIQATQSITLSYSTTTNPSGYYALNVISGTYTVDATAFGYLPAEVAGVGVTQDMTTTVNFALEAAPSHVLSVTVVDANTGWPLYAVTSLGGTPLNPVWNNPVTGHFELTLPDGWVYTLGVDAWTPGYLHQDVTVGPFYSDTEVVVELEPDQAACTAPGYHFVLQPSLATDFEANNGGFYAAGSNSSWEWGVPTTGPGAAHSGTKVWATNLDGNYNYYEDSYLYSPVIDLSGQADKDVVVSWWQWLQTQDGGDYASIQVSNDGGIYWYWWYGGVTGDVDLSWAQHSITLDPSYAVSNFQIRFHLSSDGDMNSPGWYVDDIAVGANVCTPMAGGLVVGNVSEANQGMPIAGATVANDSGFSTLTAATVDPAIDDSFYVLFSPAGSHQFTASYDDFTPDVETVDVMAGDTVRQDFALTAGHLAFNPLSMSVNLLMGSGLSQTLTITNDGSSPASFAIAEIDKGSQPALNSAARTVTIPATASEPPAGTEVAKGSGYQPRPELTIHIPAAPAAGQNDLIVCADDYPCEPLASQLMAFGDLGTVTSFDARYATPTLGELQAYNVVIVWSNWSFPDPYAIGDVLADYVDAGGKVINLMFAVTPWYMFGRFMDEDYTAMKSTGEANNIQCLGSYDASHPIMEGITNVCDYYRLYGSYLTPGSTAVAYWGDGEIFVAAKDNRTVVSLAMYLGYWTNMTGQGVEVVHNAIEWLGGSADVPWLSESPITGTLSSSSSQNVALTFDAGIPEITQPGEFYAQLKITNDTPYPPTTIPVTMTVVPPDTYGKLEGTVQSLGYCNNNPTPLSDANVFIESSLGLTWTLKTDDSGHYQIWMDQANSPITITVTADHHLVQTLTGVGIVGKQTTTENFGLHWDEPCVTEAPANLSTTIDIGSITTTQMTLDNAGAKASTFTIIDANGGFNPGKAMVHIPASEGKLAHTPAHFGPAPRSNAPTAGGESAAQVISTLVGEPAFVVDTTYDYLANIPDTTMPWNWNWIGYTLNGMYGGDFLNNDFSKMYVVNQDSQSLYTLDTATAATTLIGPAVPQSGEAWTGLTASTTGILYGSASDGSVSTLYTVDPATGATTVIGPITSAPCIIDIAINTFGEMYGVDICNDVLVRINPATGAGTVIGSLGVDADYAQGLDFEENTGILYWASWNYNVYGGELRIIDTNTGNSTAVGNFPGYEEVDCLAFATQAPSDAPWLSEQPITGTLAADTGHQDVTVTFDASVVPQPGQYNAEIMIKNDDPFNGLIRVPVDMTVNPTADWGLLDGTVTGLGYCDQAPAPLEGALITVEDASGMTYAINTDASGHYQRWLVVAGSPYTVSVTAEGYASQFVENVVIPSLSTITENFNLRWLQPCVDAAPSPLVVDVSLGNDKTVLLNLTNNGAASSDFELSEREGSPLPAVRSVRKEAHPIPAGANATQAPQGYVPSLSKTSYSPPHPLGGTVAVFKDYDPWATQEVENYLTANGIPYEVHTSAEFGTLDFDNFSMIIFSSDQSQTFYDAYASYVDKFTAYVEGGGFLNFFTADGWNGGMLNAPLPGGMAWSQYYENYNNVDDPAHPVMAGIPNPFFGPWSASYGHFYNLPADAHIIATEQYNVMPTIVEYPLGAGWLIAFTQPLEISHYYGWDIGMIMENTLLWGNAFQPVVDIPWLAESPITGTIAHDSSFPVGVTFTAFPTMTVGGVFTASLIVKSDDPVNSSIKVPVLMTVVAPVYGVAISPDESLTGLPGQTVVYAVTITNTSVNSSDSFTVSLSASAWTSTLDVTEVGPLAAGESATVHVNVTVPADVVLPDHDTVQVTATSQGDPGVSASTSLTTNAGGSFGVDLEPEASMGSGRPGDVITYTLRLTNTGITTDTIEVSVAGAGAAWVTLPQASFVLGAGQAVDVLVVVTITAGATPGDYPVTVTATSHTDPLQTDDVLITTTVIQSNIYLPLIWRAP